MSKFTFTIFTLILLLTLIIRFYFVYQNRKVYRDGDRVEISLLLLNDVDSNSKNINISANLPDTFPSERVSIVLAPQESIHYGQYLHISGKIKTKLLSTGRIVTSIYYPKIGIWQSLSDPFFMDLYFLREQIISVYQSTLSNIDSSLLLGIVFGIKGNMPKSFTNDLQKTGLTHVIAASGMNVTMVAGFLIFVFTKYLRRQTAILFAIVTLLLYAIFSGLQASIVRATLMGIFAFAGQALGKQYVGYYGLVLTAFAMLLYSPSNLFDVGFLLSMLATLGILVINPLFETFNFLSEDIATTTSAQLFTVPVILTAFGQYSLLSILTNVLVLWTIPILMIIGSLAAAVGIVLPSIGGLIVYLAIPLLWYFEAIVSFFAGIAAPLQLSNISPILISGYYLIIFAIVYATYKKQKLR